MITLSTSVIPIRTIEMADAYPKSRAAKAVWRHAGAVRRRRREVEEERLVGMISGVIIDQCLDHGWGFPPGHLHPVMRFVRRGGLRLARSRGLARRSDTRD